MRPTTAELTFHDISPLPSDTIPLAIRAVERSFRTGVTASPLGDSGFIEWYAYLAQYHFLRQLQPSETVAGHKVALTTKASRDHLGVHEPCYGHILSPCVYPNDAEVPIGNLAAPHVESRDRLRSE